MEKEQSCIACPEETPEWFLNLLGQGLSIGKDHHDILEAILGISRLLEVDPSEAFNQSQKVFQTILMYRELPTIPSEQDSTQVTAMLASNLYPSYICERIRQIVQQSPTS